MDGIQQYGLSQAVSPQLESGARFAPPTKKQADVLVLEQSIELSAKIDTKVSFSLNDITGALSLSAEKVMNKLNEILKSQVPDGVQSLDPARYTPEATAERIVEGATAFFGAYARQNPELQGEELINGFMETIRGGIDQGFEDAFGTLENIGAFELEGVKDAVLRTKELVEQKLTAYEENMRKRLGVDPVDIEEEVAKQTQDAVSKTAGVSILNLAA